MNSELRHTTRILFLGDVCSEAGRSAVGSLLPRLVEGLGVQFVIANAENAAGGYGITPRLAEELLGFGIDCLTTGDHAFDRKEGWELFGREPRLLRPLNYPPGVPGRGYGRFEKDGVSYGVINLQGRVFMRPLDCPFRQVQPVVDEIRRQTRVILVDFHAEATAEKQAMGWFLDGRVSAVLGTHTHVQTADARVLPAGTAYVTDVGMCGATDSVLGMQKEDSLRRLLEMLPVRLHPATLDPRVDGVLVEVNIETGRAEKVERVSLAPEPEPETPERNPDSEVQAVDGTGVNGRAE